MRELETYLKTGSGIATLRKRILSRGVRETQGAQPLGHRDTWEESSTSAPPGTERRQAVAHRSVPQIAHPGAITIKRTSLAYGELRER